MQKVGWSIKVVSEAVALMRLFLLVTNPSIIVVFVPTTTRHFGSPRTVSNHVYGKTKVWNSNNHNVKSEPPVRQARTPKWKLLYKDLMNLCKDSKNDVSFSYKDHTIGDDITESTTSYRIFGYYSLPMYEDFAKHVGSLECRGHMFQIDNTSREEPLRMVCWPEQKFFNLNENESTSNLDLSTIKFLEEKADGSLVSSYYHHLLHKEEEDGKQIRLKSQKSLESDQAIDAMEWLTDPSRKELYNEISELTLKGYTVNMEWVSPKNQIVLGYNQESLCIFSIRNTTDGTYLDLEELLQEKQGRFPLIIKSWVPRLSVADVSDGTRTRVSDIEEDDDNDAIVQSVREKINLEGYILHMEDGKRVKLKTDWYRSLHSVRGKVIEGGIKNLYLAAIDDNLDDMKDIDFPMAKRRIEAMEKVVRSELQLIRNKVGPFLQANAPVLGRAEFAKAAQKEFSKKQERMYFGLAMEGYVHASKQRQQHNKALQAADNGEGGSSDWFFDAIDCRRFLKVNYDKLGIQTKFEKQLLLDSKTSPRGIGHQTL